MLKCSNSSAKRDPEILGKPAFTQKCTEKRLRSKRWQHRNAPNVPNADSCCASFHTSQQVLDHPCLNPMSLILRQWPLQEKTWTKHSILSSGIKKLIYLQAPHFAHMLLLQWETRNLWVTWLISNFEADEFGEPADGPALQAISRVAGSTREDSRVSRLRGSACFSGRTAP